MIAVLLVVVGPVGKPEAATAVVVAPDDGNEDDRNMLSCKFDIHGSVHRG